MALDIVLIAGILLGVVVHLLLRRRFQSIRRLRLPPGPSGVPILGALPQIGPMPHASLANLAVRYGPIMYLRMGTTGVVVASSAGASRSFLKALDLQFANRPLPISGKDVTYDGQDFVFANYGPRWKLLRKLANLHFLGSKALTKWAPVRCDEIGRMLRAMLESSRNSRPVMVSEAMVCASANIIGQVMLSRRLFESQGEESNQFKDAITELLAWSGKFSIGDFVPAIAWMDLQGVQRQLRRVHVKLDALITAIMAEHEATAHEREGRPDVVDLVMANRFDADGVSLSDVNMKGFISDMFIAGTDTSSIMIEWALAEMLRNPTILQRAQDEMDQVIGKNRRLAESDIPSLPYLRAICKEALRLHPSTPLSLPHYTFESCEVDGYHIPPNTRLIVNDMFIAGTDTSSIMIEWALAEMLRNPTILQRAQDEMDQVIGKNRRLAESDIPSLPYLRAICKDPDVWEHALEFKPERFLSGRNAKIEPLGNDFELIPFGAGRRICVGMHAGLIMLQYGLGSLLHSFHWKLADDVEELDMKEKFGAVLPKAVPLKAVVKPRLLESAYM
ncbi:hypothetical protein C4D60_Mb02t01920 [Musa balbisiana]|uniref:Flavonoid 3',5'-hydroxylase n=1 Tax=Musa balbisiana TaxID=52838 RepID=A0A4S8I7J9_MUSBA|nr:hypothetical protein C4D60_Mb02t01920 [Musa balbisiana]